MSNKNNKNKYFKKPNTIVSVPTDSDCKLTLEISQTTITTEHGTHRGNDVIALVLTQDVGLESDGVQCAILTKDQAQTLASKLWGMVATIETKNFDVPF